MIRAHPGLETWNGAPMPRDDCIREMIKYALLVPEPDSQKR